MGYMQGWDVVANENNAGSKKLTRNQMQFAFVLCDELDEKTEDGSLY
jgi:hypothetical protein